MIQLRTLVKGHYRAVMAPDGQSMVSERQVVKQLQMRQTGPSPENNRIDCWLPWEDVPEVFVGDPDDHSHVPPTGEINGS